MYIPRTGADDISSPALPHTVEEQILSDETFQYVPIEANLKLFLEQPGYMSNITDYKQNASREDYVVKSYLDGLYYKAKNNQVLDKSMTIDLLLYNDEFETANPLGSKKGKHKVLGIYISLICLPRKFQAKLDNILVALAKSSVVSKYGINAILAPLTNELECLYTRGMTINSPGEFVGNIKPKIFQSIGDNLALNTILGFTTSKTRKADTHHQTVEDKTSLRTQNGIGDDIEVNDVSKTGLKMSSQLNQLSYYHVAENTCPDIMHDFLEGLLPIEMKLVLAELAPQGLFSLQDFNSRLHSFSYGFNDQSNKPSPIPQGKLLNPFGSSGQTSAQMHCLSLYFLLIVGDKVSEGLNTWNYFKYCFKYTNLFLHQASTMKESSF